MEYHDNWLLKSSCFQFFGDGKYGLFLSQNVNGNMIFTDHWKVLVLNFSEMGNTVFFEPKSWLKYKIYWLQESSCFELFGDSKYGLFWAKKLMERWYLPGLFKLFMIFQDLGNMVFLAVLDNGLAHPDVPVLDWMEVILLPPNSTSITQLIDRVYVPAI